jgi:hypothetical protein
VHQHCPTLKPYVPNLNGLQVIVLGGSTSTMLGKLGVAEAAHGNNLDADGDEEETEGLTNSFDDEEAAPMTSLDNLTVKLQEIRRSTATFTAIDKNFLRPFFTKDDKRRNSTEGHGKGIPKCISLCTQLLHFSVTGVLI